MSKTTPKNQITGKVGKDVVAFWEVMKGGYLARKTDASKLLSAALVVAYQHPEELANAFKKFGGVLKDERDNAIESILVPKPKTKKKRVAINQRRQSQARKKIGDSD